MSNEEVRWTLAVSAVEGLMDVYSNLVKAGKQDNFEVCIGFVVDIIRDLANDAEKERKEVKGN